MRAIILYESMFGSTRKVAEAIAEGLADCADVCIEPVAQADREVLDGVDLLVIGAPTHLHGLPRPSSRRMASQQAAKPGSGVDVEPGVASGLGVREWLGAVREVHVAGAAAFDTRFDGVALFTGRASRVIARALRRHGVTSAARPESFIVDKSGKLVAGEAARARAWGEQLARSDCLAHVGKLRKG